MENEIILDWKIVGGSIVALLVFVCGWGYKLWYEYLKINGDKVKKKVENEVDSNVQNYKKIKEVGGIEKFANRLLDLTELKQKIKDGKSYFEKNMIFSGVSLLIFGTIYSILSSNTELLKQYQIYIFIALIISVLYLISGFYNLYKCKNYVEKYLSGTPIDDIFKEE